MMGEQLRAGREKKGWNQAQAACHLGVSQPYLSLLERGERRVPKRLARKVTDVYGLSAAALPLEAASEELRTEGQEILARDLAALGYPGLAYLGVRRRKRNPADVLVSGLDTADLDSRLVEALPWVVWNFPDIDWRWVTRAVKLHDLQNRLGFVTDVARRVAEKHGEEEKAKFLAERKDLTGRHSQRTGVTTAHGTASRYRRRMGGKRLFGSPESAERDRRDGEKLPAQPGSPRLPSSWGRRGPSSSTYA